MGDKTTLFLDCQVADAKPEEGVLFKQDDRNVVFISMHENGLIDTGSYINRDQARELIEFLRIFVGSANV